MESNLFFFFSILTRQFHSNNTGGIYTNFTLECSLMLGKSLSFFKKSQIQLPPRR